MFTDLESDPLKDHQIEILRAVHGSENGVSPHEFAATHTNRDGEPFAIRTVYTRFQTLWQMGLIARLPIKERKKVIYTPYAISFFGSIILSDILPDQPAPGSLQQMSQ
jgi:hypothetical protein